MTGEAGRPFAAGFSGEQRPRPCPLPFSQGVRLGPVVGSLWPPVPVRPSGLLPWILCTLFCRWFFPHLALVACLYCWAEPHKIAFFVG